MGPNQTNTGSGPFEKQTRWRKALPPGGRRVVYRGRLSWETAPGWATQFFLEDTGPIYGREAVELGTVSTEGSESPL
jgi:hypothetical protein